MDNFAPPDVSGPNFDEWIQAIPRYQRVHIEQMLAQENDPLTVASAWLDTAGPRDTAPYGGIRVAATSFYENVLRELQKLFCGDSSYLEERKSLGSMAESTKIIVVSSVASFIAPHVGAEPVVLMPAVAVILGVLTNAGNASLCEALTEVAGGREEI